MIAAELEIARLRRANAELRRENSNLNRANASLIVELFDVKQELGAAVSQYTALAEKFHGLRASRRAPLPVPPVDTRFMQH